MVGSESASGGAPKWDLSSIYPSLSSREFADAKARLAARAADFLARLAAAPGSEGALGDWLVEALAFEEEVLSLHETLSAYAYAAFSTSTGDAEATAQINALEELGLPIQRAELQFRDILAARRSAVEALMDGARADPRIAPFAFHLREELFWQSRQMPAELEDLAADLSRSGGNAWGRLQESVTSAASAPWDEHSRKTLVELRNLAYDRDRTVREKAYRTELELCKAHEIPVAAALNGVKGFSVSLNARRGWDAALDKSLRQARMTRAALDALIASMEESLPTWRKYLKAKAGILGIGRCGFYDLFAPVGGTVDTFSFSQARDFILREFSAFDPAMGGFADRAFASRWIDAEPRPGKIGGAYCIDFPGAKACRVLCNFDGSFNSVSTIAHELGHAWHAEVVRGLPYVYSHYPMTLAETASLFSETLVFKGALRAASGPRRAYLLELHLQDACQVIVDILSRFYFERAVFERRLSSELSPEELCSLMLDAQRKTYGDGLDGSLMHPYMWLVKTHYYSSELAFYNFPYAFGQLFSAGLFARYEAEGGAFTRTYRQILEDTGRASAVEVAAAAGFDLEKPDFWREGLTAFASEADELAGSIGSASLA